MSYREDLYPASYKGVPFYVKSHTTRAGRRRGIYQLPFENRGVAHTDQGLAPREFVIDAVLIETDSVPLRQQRDALLEALEAEGTGILVHPTLGRVDVVIEGLGSLTESTEMGGTISLTFTCVKARASTQVTTKADTRGAVINRSLALRLGAGNEIARRVNTGVPDFISTLDVAVLNEIINDIQSINNKIGTFLAVPANFAAQIDRLANQTATLVSTPLLAYNTVDTTLASLMQSWRTVAGRNRAGIGNLQDIAVSSSALGSSADAPPATDTPSREAQRINYAIMLKGYRASALASLAAVAADTTYASADEALEIMTTLTEELTKISDDAISGIEVEVDFFDAVRELIASLTAHLSQTAGALDELTTYSTANTTPVLVLANSLYGDATRFEEILERNPRIVHPFAVPGGIDLEVLSS